METLNLWPAYPNGGVSLEVLVHVEVAAFIFIRYEPAKGALSNVQRVPRKVLTRLCRIAFGQCLEYPGCARM